VARTEAALHVVRDAILRERPSAQVLTFPADVRDVAKAEAAVAATVSCFGRLDILVANAAILRRFDGCAFSHTSLYENAYAALVFASKDAKGWWDVVEVNLRGSYNYIQCGCPTCTS
jgi:NAD(P)-dependent dehydrogenase (short-subunit alcohol dehydrogenase family)